MIPRFCAEKKPVNPTEKIPRFCAKKKLVNPTENYSVGIIFKWRQMIYVSDQIYK